MNDRDVLDAVLYIRTLRGLMNIGSAGVLLFVVAEYFDQLPVIALFMLGWGVAELFTRGVKGISMR